MLIPIEPVINFIVDEGLGPYKITRSDPEMWRIQIHEPSAWGTNDRKWRCGIGVKIVEDKKIVVYNGFKAVALYGADYHGSFFKFIKLIKCLESISEAKQYFFSKYLIGTDIHALTEEYTSYEVKKTTPSVFIPDDFERLDFEKHTEYVEYLLKRGVAEERIQKTKLFINDKEKRIVFPVYEDGELLFYTGRDVSGKNPIPWKKSFGDNKHPVWNLDVVNNIAYVFEACFDAINVKGGIALFGIGTETQMKKILRARLNKVILVFDNDQAGRNARLRWAEWLTSHMQSGVYVYNYLNIKEKDFGLMAQNKVDFQLKERIVFWDYRAKLLMKMGKIV